MAATAQLPLVDTPSAARRRNGYVRNGRHKRPNITTLALSLDERATAQQLADELGTSIGDVLRRGLDLLAAQHRSEADTSA